MSGLRLVSAARTQASRSLVSGFSAVHESTSYQVRHFQAKTTKKKKKASTGGGSLYSAEDYDIMVRALEGKKKDFPTLSEEEIAREKQIRETYNREYQKRDREMRKQIQLQIHLKWAAILRLPTEEMKAEAVEPDYVPVPASLKPPRATPLTAEERAARKKETAQSREQMEAEMRRILRQRERDARKAAHEAKKLERKA